MDEVRKITASDVANCLIDLVVNYRGRAITKKDVQNLLCSIQLEHMNEWNEIIFDEEIFDSEDGVLIKSISENYEDAYGPGTPNPSPSFERVGIFDVLQTEVILETWDYFKDYSSKELADEARGARPYVERFRKP